nr:MULTISPECIES: hypothetical protein [unclassified Mycolicibacterium]
MRGGSEGVRVRSSLKAKKTCCGRRPRSGRCPLVLHEVDEAELSGLRGKLLDKVVKRARKA